MNNNEIEKAKLKINHYFEILKRHDYLSEEIKKINISSTDLGEEASKKRIVLNEYAKEIGKLNIEIDEYNIEAKSSRFKTIREYIACEAEIVTLDGDIKAAEDLSKNSGNTKLTYNAAGQKRHIDVELIEEYNQMVKRKRIVASNLRKNKTLLSGVDYNYVKAEFKENIPVIPAIDLWIEKPIQEFDDLPVEEKISETEKRLTRIIGMCNKPNMGKKRLVNINGTKIDMPICIYGKYKETSMLLNKLKKEKETTITIPEIETPALNASEPIALAIKDPVGVPAVIEKPVEAKLEINKKQSLSGFIKSKLPVVEDKLLSIPKKIRKAFNTSEFRQKAASIACTILAISTLFISGKMLLKQIKQIKNNPNKSSYTEITDGFHRDYTITPTVAQNEVKENMITNTNIVSRPEVESVVSLGLGDSVYINSENPIYKNAEDAAKKERPLRQYFTDNEERIVEALTYEVTSENGNIVYETVFAKDNNAKEKIDTLTKRGAIVKSALITKAELLENGQYEGYKNIEDISLENIYEKGVTR